LEPQQAVVIAVEVAWVERQHPGSDHQRGTARCLTFIGPCPKDAPAPLGSELLSSVHLHSRRSDGRIVTKATSRLNWLLWIDFASARSSLPVLNSARLMGMERDSARVSGEVPLGQREAFDEHR
jgi:hypothetical protein